MNITLDLRDNAGLQWVLERLTPFSPFGKAAARKLPWYGPGQEAALEAELGNVALALTLLDENESALRGVNRCLPLFHDVRGSLERDPQNPLDLVELFELKHFLLTLEQLATAYHGLPPFAGVYFPDLRETLDLLDPDGRRLPTFSIDSSYHTELGPLREQKLALEREIRSVPEHQRPPLLDRRRLLAVREDQLELAVRTRLTAAILSVRDDFFVNMAALGRLDLALAKAKLARRHGCIRPTLSQNRALTLLHVRHPQVAEDLEARHEEFTPLDLTLAPGCAVITGANMGGKTVALRAVVLSLLLCQSGFFVFAEAATLPLFHRVELILADAGPGSGGLSSFGREVHALDNLLRETGDEFFFVALDEFARGTNPQEGAALARALVRHLGSLHCVALLTTHYDGVSDVATTHYQVAGLVREIEGDSADDPRRRIARRMDYRLRAAPPGAPCPRDALRVCRLLKLDPALMQLFEQ